MVLLSVQTVTPRYQRSRQQKARPRLGLGSATGLELLNLVGHDGSVMDVAIGADGSSTPRQDRLHYATGIVHPLATTYSTFARARKACFRLDVSPDGLQAASASWDGTVRVWDTENTAGKLGCRTQWTCLGVDFT